MKKAVVTGANAGMGFATALALANAGMHVLMLCRNEERGQKALDALDAKKEAGSAELYSCDLASMASIRRAVKEIARRHQALDLLIANAGVVSPRREETEDGFEMHLGVNHLGHFLLVNQLLPQLESSEDARVIIVSSGAHKWGCFHWEDPHLHFGYNVAKAYGQSKLANLLFAHELTKRLEGSGVSVFSLHPGAVSTSLGVNRETEFGATIHKLLRPFFQTTEKGASTAIHLALSTELPGVTGSYFVNKQQVKPAPSAVDDCKARQLWLWSEKQTGLG
ncbi:SDR family oxidoreductase [Shouchella shacheensis]|uniref:SDR family oxidoreductase n=1 Tax=Shouchella shacheensis TaxID=1649580 RepID=UPI0007404730|nr:SDR family oxidoreductase [Shouchella shacheensis]